MVDTLLQVKDNISVIYVHWICLHEISGVHWILSLQTNESFLRNELAISVASHRQVHTFVVFWQSDDYFFRIRRWFFTPYFWMILYMSIVGIPRGCEMRNIRIVKCIIKRMYTLMTGAPKGNVNIYEGASAASERCLFNKTEKSQHERPGPARPRRKRFWEAFEISATTWPIHSRSFYRVTASLLPSIAYSDLCGWPLMYEYVSRGKMKGC